METSECRNIAGISPQHNSLGIFCWGRFLKIQREIKWEVFFVLDGVLEHWLCIFIFSFVFESTHMCVEDHYFKWRDLSHIEGASTCGTYFLVTNLNMLYSREGLLLQRAFSKFWAYSLGGTALELWHAQHVNVEHFSLIYKIDMNHFLSACRMRYN